MITRLLRQFLLCGLRVTVVIGHMYNMPTEKTNAALKVHKFDKTWPSYPVEVFRNATYDSYNTARVKAKKAEETRDLNSSEADDIQLVKKKRKIRRKVFNDSSTDDDESPPELTSGNLKTKICLKLPTPIKKDFPLKDNAEYNGSFDGIIGPDPLADSSCSNTAENEVVKEANNVVETNILNKHVTPKTSFSKIGNKLAQKDSSNILINDTQYKYISTPGTSHSNTALKIAAVQPQMSTIVNNDELFRVEMLKIGYFVKSLGKEILQEVRLLKLDRAFDPPVVESNNIVAQFNSPISSVEQLEELASETENFDKMVNELCLIGGSTLKDKVAYAVTCSAVKVKKCTEKSKGEMAQLSQFN